MLNIEDCMRVTPTTRGIPYVKDELYLYVYPTLKRL